MIGMFLILVVFFIHDWVLYKITESNRLWGFALYVGIAVPLFVLPFGTFIGK
jgi:hypothetical protein